MASLLNATIGEYRLTDFLGAGGMGEVYRAVHTRIGRVVAIKVLSSGGDPTAVRRFLNEARIQGRLTHPGIATLHDFTEHGGRPCIIMEFVDGQTLAELVERRGALPFAEAVAILGSVADALGYIHEQGIVHRDLKSHNVKVTSSGQVKLLDFGIARAASSQRLTAAGAVVGTLQYLAPEQIEGRDADLRTDIWAMGVLFYELLTGRLPFEGASTAELIGRVVRGDFVPPSRLVPGLPPAAAAVVAKCLKKDPAARYQTAAELRHALGARRVAPVVALPRRKLAWIAAAAVLLLVVVIAIILGGGEGQPRPGFKTITVDIAGGRADVYRDGSRAGRTPFKVTAREGEHVSLVLKREGYADVPVEFDASDRTDYSFTMEPVRE